MKTLASLILGSALMLGTAFAAQSSTAPKPAATTSKPATQTATVHKKKVRKHKKAVAKKTTKTPAAPVAKK